MPDLSFACTGSSSDRYGVGPTILLDVEVTESSGVPVHSGMLRCQIRIEPVRRHYDDGEADGLVDLFGERHRWGETLNPLQLATVPFLLPRFSGSTTVTVPVPCTYDIDIAASRYLAALGSGNVPLLLLFSGTVFYAGDPGLQVDQVPWDRDVRYGLPVAVWREAMDTFFPSQGWLRLHRDTLDALTRYRSRHALPSWEDTIERLLKESEHSSGPPPVVPPVTGDGAGSGSGNGAAGTGGLS